eukprot:4538411-Amphidinium_carterae.2
MSSVRVTITNDCLQIQFHGSCYHLGCHRAGCSPCVLATAARATITCAQREQTAERTHVDLFACSRFHLSPPSHTNPSGAQMQHVVQ